MKHRIPLAALLGFSLATFGGYLKPRIPNGSIIEFNVKQMMGAPIHGVFDGFEVDIHTKGRDMTRSTIRAVIRANSVNTRNEKRDLHLMSAQCFDVENYPEIVFESKKIERQEGGEYFMTGNLTMKGVTREISFPCSFTGPVKDSDGIEWMGLEAQLTINRQDFGVSWNRALANGGFLVSDAVGIDFDIAGIIQE